MKNYAKILFLLIPAVAFLVSGCGGGGGGGGPTGPVASTRTFSLAQATGFFLGRSHTINYKLTGSQGSTSFTGSGTITIDAATGATFEGQQALSQTLSITGTITGNGKTVPYAKTATSYYTTNYNGLGDETAGSYCVARSPIIEPTSVKVGDTANEGVEDCYSDNTKNTKTEIDYESYVMEPDTADTAIVNFITNSYTTRNVQLSSSQERWRLDLYNVPIFVSLSYSDYTTSPATILTFTAN